MTREDAEKLGWAISIDGEDGHAEKDGMQTLDVTSEIPLFNLLLHVSDLEGQPIDTSGGVTPELVAAVSGETYKPMKLSVVEPPSPWQQIHDGLNAATDLAGVKAALLPALQRLAELDPL